MEAAVVNTLSAGDTVLVLRAGKFGERWEEICRAYGVTVIPLDRALRRDGARRRRSRRRLREHPEARAVLMQHSESSTGVLHDVKGIAAVTRADRGDPDRRRGVEPRHRRPAAWTSGAWTWSWPGSQKGLMLPPGLSFCALSEKAWGHVKASRLPKYYFDIATERKFVAQERSRFTPAVSIFVGLREVLKMIEAEGLAERVPAPRAAGPRHALGRGGARARALRQGRPEPGPHRGGRPARDRQRGGARPPTRPRTTSRSRAGRAR